MTTLGVLVGEHNRDIASLQAHLSSLDTRVALLEATTLPQRRAQTTLHALRGSLRSALTGRIGMLLTGALFSGAGWQLLVHLVHP